jgi:cysteinyl-tRNA synthetase
MALRVYNTLTKRKDPFDPVEPGKVGIYLCGPTVYKSPHVGHMVGPVIFDAVKRYLTFRGFKVTWVTNITDVDDKLINAAMKAGLTMKAMAERHTAEYLECLAKLGVDGIDAMPKASEHMPEIIALCEKLVGEGKAYAADGNVWFDVSRDNDYGKLSNRRPEDQEAGNRDLEGSGKRNATDFALWKAAKKGEPAWDSPWGPGRPGWHIECSAMSMKILGPTFDIHGGGMDLMFPHHENELAQSEQATGKPFVKVWMHNGLTRVRTKAASGEWKTDDIHESTGNAASVRANQLIDTHGSDVLRYLLLSSHYRRPIEFTDEALANAKKATNVFARLFERVERLTGLAPAAAAELAIGDASLSQAVGDLRSKFLEMMDDDFNTAGATAALHEMAGVTNAFVERNDLEKTKDAAGLASFAAAAGVLKHLGGLLGLFRVPAAAAKPDDGLTEKLMQLLIRLRAESRAAKNFAVADGIRKGLTEIGITLEDRADGTGWRKV